VSALPPGHQVTAAGTSTPLTKLPGVAAAASNKACVHNMSTAEAHEFPWWHVKQMKINEMTTPCASACSHLKQDLVQALWQKQD